MPVFKYRARTQDGRPTSGTVESFSQEEAGELLRERELIVLSLTKTSGHSGRGLNMNIGRVSAKDLVIFSRQMAVMVAATVPIVQTMRIIAQQTTNPLFAEKILAIANDVEGGMKLSDALAKHPGQFSNFFVAMVRSGETSGKLEEVFEYIASQMEKDYDLISRIRGAMIYPAFILVAMLVVGFLMMVFVLPKMTDMLKENNTELPWVSKLLIAVSDWLAANWLYIVGFIVLLCIVFFWWIRKPSGKAIADRIRIRFPIFGKIYKEIYLVRFTRSLSTLIHGGVPIAAALRITAEVVDNRLYKDLIEETIQEVEGGNSISTVFSRSDLMPKMLSQMMVIGERTGKLDSMLDRLSQFYTREVDNTVSNLVSLIEPMILLIMGVGVAGIVAAIMLPMYKLAQSIN